MDFKNHSSTYFDRMNASIDQKALLINHLVQGDVLELGAGSGSLAARILEVKNDCNLTLVDASVQAMSELEVKFKGNDRVTLLQATVGVDSFPIEMFDNVIASSLFHEVYSFLGFDGLINSVKSIYAALKPGGLFILRDGVIPENPRNSARVILPERLLELARKYCEQCRPHLQPILDGNVARGSRHVIAELLFTITWGEDSFEREVEEQYQLFTLKEYTGFLESVGFKHDSRYSLIQPGYRANLSDCVIESLNDDYEWVDWFPETNAVWVVRKPVNG